MSALRFGAAYGFPAAVVVGLWLGGVWPLLPLALFLALPVFDQLLGRNEGLPEPQRPLHDLALRVWVPVQLGCVALAIVSDAHPIAVGLGLGVMTGAGGINVAHELLHRASRLDRALAEILMTSVSYPWYCVEHMHGHHRWVGTPRDAATARLGESVYGFVLRSATGGLRSFAAFEADRCQRHGVRGLGDRRVRYALWLVLISSGLALAGASAVVVFTVQSLTAIALLEWINYVQHYGLVRREIRPGVYERVGTQHAWSSRNRVTSAVMFNLPRHADHHMAARKPYWELRSLPDAPELQRGYAAMMALALIPPLWFRVMAGPVAAARRTDD